MRAQPLAQCFVHLLCGRTPTRGRAPSELALVSTWAKHVVELGLVPSAMPPVESEARVWSRGRVIAGVLPGKPPCYIERRIPNPSTQERFS